MLPPGSLMLTLTRCAGILISWPTADGKREEAREVAADPATDATPCPAATRGGSGGLDDAAVATANAEAADAVDDRRDEARDEVTTTPALEANCGESGC